MKKLILLLTLICGINFWANTQTITDFDCTGSPCSYDDIDGGSHSLYGYLNSGKTVALWFFQHTGAQSIADATFIEQLHFDFGLNAGDYIVLGLHSASANSIPSSATLNTWKTDNSINFPILGGDGPAPSGNGYYIANYYQNQFANDHLGGLGVPALAVICADGGGPTWDNSDILFAQKNTVVYAEAYDPMNCWAIGTGSRQYKEGVLMYPNPATDQLSLMINKQSASIGIYNMLGEMVTSDNYTGTGIFNMDISDLTAGYYMVEVQTEEYIRTLKLEVIK